jgi:hypothetical protein
MTSGVGSGGGDGTAAAGGSGGGLVVFGTAHQPLLGLSVAAGRGSHSSTFQVNLSRFLQRNKLPHAPCYPLITP